jgi:hypothetical protein
MIVRLVDRVVMTTVHLVVAALTVTTVVLAETMIALVVVRVVMMTGHLVVAALTVTSVVLVVMMIVHRVVAVSIAMIVVLAVISTVKTHVLRLSESQMKSVAVPVDVAQLEKCRIRQNVHVKTGLMKVQHVQHDVLPAFAQRQLARRKRVAARKCEHSIPWWKSSSVPLVNELQFVR